MDLALASLSSFSGRVSLTIAVGILASLLYSRRTGWSTGGLVTPGLLAIQAGDPAYFAGSLGLAVLFSIALRPLARGLSLYGRERVGAALLLAIAFRLVLQTVHPPAGLDAFWIGWIAPGLIAADMERQGVLMTLSAAVSTAVVTAIAVWLLLSLGGVL